MRRAATAPAIASVEAIRSRFPALDRRHNGRSVAYFDGPGGTQVPRDVVAAMGDYLYHHNANTHWHYPTSAETDAAIDDARRTLADFVNGEPSEIAFGANMTTLTFHLARALGRRWGAGDEIVATELDHHANIDPWRDLERERGVRVKLVPFDTATGQIDPENLSLAVGPRTRLLAIGGASNALGTVNDLPRAVELAHKVGALVFIDAVHSAPHVLPDVARLGCDFLACSAYKFYGPHVGVLWGRRSLLDTLDLPRLEPAPAEAPENFETGTQNHEGIVGAAAAVDFLASLGRAPGLSRRAALERAYAALHARGQRLFERLWKGLEAIASVRLYGPPPDAPRTPTVSFAVEGAPADSVAEALAERAVFVSSGDFYAKTVVERLGHAVDGVVRAGCACYTTDEEIERLVEAVREAAAGERRAALGGRRARG
ncbi:MAG TPA: cysteine desulfurase-like protein [Thermoanaerobaculia bacterium]|nr:cysteine desulfurase-like protein [Thermoanaerobaculia bacterium]